METNTRNNGRIPFFLPWLSSALGSDSRSAFRRRCNSNFLAIVLTTVSLLMVWYSSDFAHRRSPKKNGKDLRVDDAAPQRCKIWVHIKLIEHIKCANPCWNGCRRNDGDGASKRICGWFELQLSTIKIFLSLSFHPQSVVFSCMFHQKYINEQRNLSESELKKLFINVSRIKKIHSHSPTSRTLLPNFPSRRIVFLVSSLFFCVRNSSETASLAENENQISHKLCAQ